MVESLDRKVKQEISGFTVKQVTGGMKVINWNKHKDKWSHTKGIQFPKPASKKYIDILLGKDYSQFHISIKEVKGKNGDTFARLTSLDWTCVGQPITLKTQMTNVIKKISNTQSMMTADEEKAVNSVQDLVQCKDGQYELVITRQRDPECLPDNYGMAVKKIMSTERKLLRDDKTSNEYNQIIEDYNNKRSAKILEKDPETESKKWHLPHFQSSSQIKEQQRQELYPTLQQLKMVQV